MRPPTFVNMNRKTPRSYTKNFTIPLQVQRKPEGQLINIFFSIFQSDDSAGETEVETTVGWTRDGYAMHFFLEFTTEKGKRATEHRYIYYKVSFLIFIFIICFLLLFFLLFVMKFCGFIIIFCYCISCIYFSGMPGMLDSPKSSKKNTKVKIWE